MGKVKILIIEDELSIVEELKEVLKILDYEIIKTVTSKDQFIESTINLPIDIIIMGIKLKELINSKINIKEIDIPILYTTTYSDFSDNILTKVKLENLYRYITRPFNQKDVYTTIELTLHNHKRNKELKNYENQYRKLLENISYGILEFDLSNTITFANLSLHKILNYEEDEFIGKNLDELLTDSVKDNTIKQLKLLRTSQVLPQEPLTIQLISKNKNIVYTQINLSQKKNYTGEVIGYIALIRDVTDKIIAEKLLKEERDKAQKYLEIAEVIFLVIDIEGKVLLINRKGCEVLEYEESEIVNKNWFDIFVPKEIREKIKNLHIRRSNGNVDTTGYYEGLVLTKGNDEKTIAWHNKLIFDSVGKVSGILSSGEDITLRKKIEKLQKDSEQKYRLIFDKSPVGIFSFGKDGVITHCNETFLKITGVDFIGFNTNQLKSEKIKNAINECLEGKQSSYEGYYTIEITNETKIIKATFSPIKSDDDNIEGGICIIADTSEETKIKEALQESEEKYRSLFTNMTTGFSYNKMILNKENKVIDYVFIDINDALTRLTGLKRSKIVGRKVTEIIDDINESEPDYFEKLSNALLTRKEFKMEPYISQIGKWISLYAYPLKDRYFATIYEDITERKIGEDSLKSLLREKETLLKEIHHRVKNNLQIISSLLSIQSRNIKDKNIVSMFKESQNRIKTMAIIHEKLYQSDDLKTINLSDYVNNLVKSLCYSYGEKSNIKLKTDIENTMLDIDLAVPCGLIINELVSNALKYAFPNNETGEISIYLHKDDNDIIDNQLSKRYYKLIISDNGVGLKKDAENCKSQSLGLQLAEGLVIDRLKGTFEIYNNGGTNFIIRFPEAKN